MSASLIAIGAELPCTVIKITAELHNEAVATGVAAAGSSQISYTTVTGPA